MDGPAINPMLALISGMMPTPVAAAGLGRLPDLQACDVLLCGAAASCRSSLALHFALNHAARTKLPALFLCRQDGLEQAVPVLPHLCNADDPSLHLLHIKYLSSQLDLQRFASCLHLLRGAYAAIVVEDISGVIRGDDRNALVRTLALLLDGVRAYRVSSGCGAQCQLLVTDSSDEARRPRYIFDRWFPLTMVLSPCAAPSGRNGVFCLAVAPQSGGQPHADSRATGGQDAGAGSVAPAAGPRCMYRLSGSCLVLEAVHALGGAAPEGGLRAGM